MRNLIFSFSFLTVVIAGTGMNPLSFIKVTMTSVQEESSGQDTSRYVYVGAEACAGKCHNGDELGYQYGNWKISRHARSYEALASEKASVYSRTAGISESPQESLTCLRCHVTAAGYAFSSLGPSYKMEDGITCEACHKGEFIPATFLPEESDCLKCHNNSVHEVAAFDFVEGCLKISHPRLKTKQR